MKIFNNTGIVTVDFGTVALANIIYVAEITVTDSLDGQEYHYRAAVEKYNTNDYRAVFHLAAAVSEIYYSNKTLSANVQGYADSDRNQDTCRQYAYKGDLYRYDDSGNKILASSTGTTNQLCIPAYRRLGQANVYTDLRDTFLTDFTRVYHWESYPLEVSFFTDGTSDNIIMTGGSNTNITGTADRAINIPLDRSGTLTVNGVSIPVVDVKECYQNPVYFAWMNSKGGYSFYMGEGETVSTKPRRTAAFNLYNPDMSNTQGSGAVQRIVGRYGEMNVIAEVQDRADIEAFEHLFFSNEVYVYLNGNWFRSAVMNDFAYSKTTTTIPIKLTIPQEYVN